MYRTLEMVTSQGNLKAKTPSFRSPDSSSLGTQWKISIYRLDLTWEECRVRLRMDISLCSEIIYQLYFGQYRVGTLLIWGFFAIYMFLLVLIKYTFSDFSNHLHYFPHVAQ